MLGYIKGKVLSVTDGTVLIENGGLGYEVFCSASARQKLIEKSEGEIYTYLAVRDDGLFLYGFSSPEEKAMFVKLISVSGVGPKIGIAVLSGMSLNDLAIKIATSDVKGLSSVKGLGKKMAERIVLELREKVCATEENVSNVETSKNLGAVAEDSVIALMSLGFTRGEVLPAVQAAEENGYSTVQEIVTFSLRHIR